MVKKKKRSVNKVRKLSMAAWIIGLVGLLIAIVLRPSTISMGAPLIQFSLLIVIALGSFSIAHNLSTPRRRLIGYLISIVALIAAAMFGYEAWYLATNYGEGTDIVDLRVFATKIDISFYAAFAVFLLFLNLVQVKSLNPEEMEIEETDEELNIAHLTDNLADSASNDDKEEEKQMRM